MAETTADEVPAGEDEDEDEPTKAPAAAKRQGREAKEPSPPRRPRSRLLRQATGYATDGGVLCTLSFSPRGTHHPARSLTLANCFCTNDPMNPERRLGEIRKVGTLER